MRYLKGICALVLVLGICLPAQATVQNIRVGGDIQIRGIARDTWDLDDVAGALGDDENWLDSAIRLQIEAELMDDVAASIRLINERDWEGVGAEDIELDLAYLTLDHMFGFPVKATLGRQEILFGEGFLVGDGYNVTPRWGDIIAYGKSVRRAFDALRLTYQVFPYTVDLFTAKILDYPYPDMDLYGLNIHFNHLDIATFDLGYFIAEGADVEVRALSLRGEGEILIQGAPGLTVKGEHVWQAGDAGAGIDLEDARGWYLGAEYALPDVLYEPYFGVAFIFMSGDDPDTREIETFDPLFEDKAWGTFAELNPLVELSTNAKIWRLAAGLRPTDALSLGLSYYILELEEPVVELLGVRDEDLGDELNLNLTFDYTEDVQFGLCMSWFDPGDALVAEGDDTATQIVGSVKVSF